MGEAVLTTTSTRRGLKEASSSLWRRAKTKRPACNGRRGAPSAKVAVHLGALDVSSALGLPVGAIDAADVGGEGKLFKAVRRVMAVSSALPSKEAQIRYCPLIP